MQSRALESRVSPHDDTTFALGFRFPGGRYHATPWDSNVNEGRVEWPPSPWRLLRALLAMGYTRVWMDRLPTAATSEWIDVLSRARPSYRLPATGAGHTRHYMPVAKRDTTAKVLDAFVTIDPTAQLLVVWNDVSLTSAAREELQALVEALPYLGRAESWVEGQVVKIPNPNPGSAHGWCHPAGVDQGPGANDDGTLVRLLAPRSDFADWRADMESQLADQSELTAHRAAAVKGKTLTAAAVKKARAKAIALLPADRLASLELETSVWQRAGWAKPPGSDWCVYALPKRRLRPPAMKTPVRSSAKRVTCAIFALDGQGKTGRILPSARRALPLAEVLHAGAVRAVAEENLPLLTGRDDSGRPVSGSHPHASWIPLSLLRGGSDESRQASLDHVLVYAPGYDGEGGLGPAELDALSRVRWAYAKGIVRIGVALTGSGDTERMRESLNASGLDTAVLQTAKRWRSVRPYVARQFLRRGQSLEHQVRREWSERRPDAEASLLDVHSRPLREQPALLGYQIRRRRSKPQPPMPVPHALELEFDRPVAGPLMFGYGSHFGLGLFEPM